MDLIISTANFHNAVKNAVHFAAPTSDNVPILSTANLVIRDKRLIIESTDRYKLLQIKVQDFSLEDDPNRAEDIPDNTVIGAVEVDHLKTIEQMLRAEARSTQKPTITLHHHHEESDLLKITSNVTSLTQEYRLFTDAEYPNINSLFDGELTEPKDQSGFDQIGLRHMQAVAKVQHTRYPKNRQDVVLHGSPRLKPVRVYWIADGDIWAQGLLMPIRWPDDAQPIAARHF